MAQTRSLFFSTAYSVQYTAEQVVDPVHACSPLLGECINDGEHCNLCVQHKIQNESGSCPTMTVLVIGGKLKSHVNHY